MTTPAFVQGRGTYGGSGSNGALAFSSPVTKGDLLVVGVEAHGSFFAGLTMSIGDDLGTDWKTLQPALQMAAGSYTYVAYGIAKASGANTVYSFISNTSGMSGWGLNLTEFSGVDSLDQYTLSGTTYVGSSPQTFVSPTITPRAAAGIAIAFSWGEATNAFNPISGTNGFTDNYGFWANFQFVDQNWKVFSTNAAIQTNLTVNFSGSVDSGRVALATFIASSGSRQRMLAGVGA